MIDRLRADLAGRYTIEREIGRGGMATVFLAQDVKHGRQVAIKVLRPELTASIGADRFLREIEISAQLSHPHILPLHDSGNADGLLYYVMPYVEGEALEDRLERDGRLPWDEAVAIAREIGDALHYAHGQGLVHRDIKPANILLSHGHAVIADFGIARAVSDSAKDSVTQAGMAVGTPAYMSPEQASADPTVNGRTDVYALGCMLYEMLAGRPPFVGKNAQEIVAKAISAPVPPIDRPAGIPPSVRDAVYRSLLKDPDARFQTAAEFTAALKRDANDARTVPASKTRRPRYLATAAAVLLLGLSVWVVQGRGSTEVTAGADVIAVVPFNAVGDDVSFLAEGMVDLLTTNLDAVGALRTVDSRTVLHRWRRRGGEEGMDLEETLAVGREVEAGSVLMGSVVEAGTSVRLNATLYSVDGDELARVQMDGPENDVLTLVDSLSMRLLRDIWSTRRPMPSVDIASVTTGSIGALRSYLRGARHYRNADWALAIEAFDDAVRADSTFALAYSLKGMAHSWLDGLGSPPQVNAIERAVQNEMRLPQRERTMVTAFSLFAQDRPEALDTMRAYTLRYPDDPVGWHTLGDFSYHAQHKLAQTPDEQVRWFERAIALDSTLSPAFIHPMDTWALAGDRVALEAWQTSAESAGRMPPESRRMWDALSADPDSAHDALVDLALTDQGRFTIAMRATVRHDPNRRTWLLSLTDSLIATLPDGDTRRLSLLVEQTLAAMAMGKAGLVERNVSRLPGSLGAVLTWHASVVRLLDSQTGLDAVEILRGDSTQTRWVPVLEAQLALRDGNVAGVRRALESASAFGSDLRANSSLAFLSGWTELITGDTAAAAHLMGGALDSTGITASGFASLTGVARLQFATALARRPESHERGIRLLRYGFQDDFGLLPLTLLALGEELERVGDDDGAAAAYSEFLELWSDADERLHPRVESARNALRRVSGENVR